MTQPDGTPTEDTGAEQEPRRDPKTGRPIDPQTDPATEDTDAGGETPRRSGRSSR